MDPLYQAEHLDFVSNNNGTTPLEIVIVGSPLHFSILFLASLSQWLGLDYTTFLGSLLELLVTILPILLSLTVLSDYSAHISLTLFLMGVSLLLVAQGSKKTKHNLSRIWDLTVSPPNRAVFLTSFRASMLLVTTICILAVDFPIFPRKFAKTETFGYGLMDLGVGSFVFSNGLVSPEARQLTSSRSIRKNLLGCVPLLFLGLARLISVTSLGYHENITEYGLHWNFFFTLASVKLLSAMVLPLVKATKMIWVLAVAVAVLYEGVLTFWAGEWIVSDAARDGLVSANREGLFSSFGYLAIYLAGVAWGREILTTRGSMAELLVVTRLLVLWTGIMWLSLAYSTTFFLPPSRRMANYTFFTWIVAYNLTLLSLFLLLDLLIMFVGEVKLGTAPDSSRSSRVTRAKPRQGQDQNNIRKLPKKTKEISPEENQTPSHECTLYRCPTIYEAIDYNGLAFFLLANLGTGAVNLSVATIHTPELPALAILTAYLVTLCMVAKILYRYNVRLKFW